MNIEEHKVALVTGARCGIGYACATALARASYTVYGTSRHPPADRLDGIHVVKMNVNETDNVEAAVAQILETEGRIDVVVNNAGFGYGGAVEDTSIEEAKALFETNFFGALRVCQAVLPTMRAQRSGLIVNVSSIGGLMGLPYQGLYSASKFALEGLTEALRLEMKAFGIDVALIEPGDIQTEFTANRKSAAGASEDHSPYRHQYVKTLEKVEEDEWNGESPDVVARKLLQIVESRNPKPRYVAGRFYEKVAVWLKRCVPNLFERLVMINYKL